MDDTHEKLDRLQRSVDQLSREVGHLRTEKEGAQDDDDDSNKERGNWTTKCSFVLACIGYAVGLGNLWRFPYLCYKNGGGAFLVPYLLSLAFLGIPVFMIEVWIGQFPSQGPLTCWGLAPVLTGVGWAGMMVSFFIGVYYNMVMAWAIYYFFDSFRFRLPWQSCDPKWAGPYCYTNLAKDAANCTQFNYTARSDGVCLLPNNSVYGIWNTTAFNAAELKITLPSSDYFDNEVLRLSEGFHDMGPVYWDLALCLLAAWVLTYLCLIKGIKTSGVVVYFTALFPYVVMIALLIQGLRLPGAEQGVNYFIKPNFSEITTASVWSDAASQIFYSLSAAMSGLQALGSYNKFHYNFVRDSFVVSIVNSLTSLVAGVIVFSFLGYLSVETGMDIDKIATDGPGLAFAVYPFAFTTMKGAPIWSIIFFGMIICLAIDSQFVGIEAVSTGLEDLMPKYLRGRKWLTNLTICVISFVLGLSLCTGGGMYMLVLLDGYSGYWNMFLICICECCGVMYIYRFNRFREDVRAMLGDYPCGPWSIFSYVYAACWGFLTPAIVLFITIFSWIDWGPLSVGDYEFPIGMEVLGILLDVGICALIVVVPLIMLCRGMSCRDLWRPRADYGPALVKHRLLIHHVPDFEVDPYNEGLSTVGGSYKKKDMELSSRF